MILPYFDYSDVIYSNSKIPEITKIDKQHFRGLRICLKTQGKIDKNEILNQAKISNLENRRKEHLRNFMFRNKSKCVKKEENVITTREKSGPTFKILKPNCESFKRNIYYSGAVEWNNLDADIRNLKEFFKFKRIRKSWLLNTYVT